MGKRRHILVVDDDFIASEALEHALTRGGMKVTVVRDGAEVLGSVRKSEPDLILLDIKLPLSGVDGWEVLMRLKSGPGTAHIPIIVLSNAGLQHEVARGLELGADAYLLKANTPIRDVVLHVRKAFGES